MNKPFYLVMIALLAHVTVEAVDFQRWKTSDGITITLVERHELPIVNMTITFKNAGQIAENKTDLANFTAQMLTSGTAKYDEETLRDQSNQIGVGITANAGVEHTSIDFSSLSAKRDLQAGLHLLNQIVVYPKFNADVLERNKKQAITAFMQKQTQPSFLGKRALTLLNYGNHPYANSARSDATSIHAITINDLTQFHQQNYAKNNAYVAIVGDVTRSQAEKMVQTALSGLPDKTSQPIEIEEVLEKTGTQQHIPFSGKEQTTVMLSLPMIVRQDPDRFALTVGNHILGGGGFDSRLMKTLRDDKGLVYGVHSSLSPLTHKGPFSIAFSTKKNSANDALEATRAVLNDFIANGPSEAELRQAKDNIIGSFPMAFDTNAKTVGFADHIGVQNLPLDYYDQYPQGIEAVTTEQVREVWQRRMNPQYLNVVIVGETDK